MSRRLRAMAAWMVAALLVAILAPGVAQAGSKGRRNTTFALGAVTVHQALKGKTTNALIAGAGTAYAYKRYRDARKKEKRQQAARRYRASTYRSRSYRRYR